MGLHTDLDNNIKITKPEKIVPQDRMDIDLPGYGICFLSIISPSIYTAPMWHAEYNSENRTYAAIQTSLLSIWM